MCSHPPLLCTVSQLNLSDNQLCGVDRRGNGTYNAEGIKAIADALRVAASLTVADLRYNELDTESATTLATVAKEKGISLCGIKPEQTEANLQGSYPNYLKPADAILLTADLAVRTSLTKILVGENELGDEGTTILCDALRESAVSKVEELNLRENDIGPEGAKAIAALCVVRSSLTRVNVKFNSMKTEGVTLLTDAVKGRADFVL